MVSVKEDVDDDAHDDVHDGDDDLGRRVRENTTVKGRVGGPRHRHHIRVRLSQCGGAGLPLVL